MPMPKQDVVAVPAARPDERFFSLGSRFAGELTQKVVIHRLKPAVVGGVSSHPAAGSAPRALVGESNRSGHVWFVSDLDALDARLGVRSS
ncbi:DUF4180 domain-containing protein [Streptosporangium sp. NPDC006007]|uniref:DUF4180 domain-containing protein n=1 Tax=Streptosporangium sp. NPDC006007 TaxID=3154575 RepID=UPI0033AD71DA